MLAESGQGAFLLGAVKSGVIGKGKIRGQEEALGDTQILWRPLTGQIIKDIESQVKGSADA